MPDQPSTDYLRDLARWNQPGGQPWTLSDEELRQCLESVYPELSDVCRDGFHGFLAEAQECDPTRSLILDRLARDALASGRTFDNRSIRALRDSFMDNAASADPRDCISIMNAGMRLLMENSQLRVGSTVQATMRALSAAGFATAPVVIEFLDKRGRQTLGTRPPTRLAKSVWMTLLDMAGGDIGWSVFGLSIMDGYHSVTLVLDNCDPMLSGIYWCDQWSTNGGWKEFSSPAALDAEITQLTQRWWNDWVDAHSGQKPRTRVTLWRIHQ